MDDPGKKAKRKNLKDEIFQLQNTKRSGAWVPDTERMELVKAPKSDQIAHRKKLKQKIKEAKQMMAGL